MFGTTLLIVNPTARSGKHYGSLAAITERLRALTLQQTNTYFEAIETLQAKDAEIIAEELGEYFDTVFVLGGDGVVHETINGLMKLPIEKRPRLAVLPAGQGNDFARSLNLDLDPIKVLDNHFQLKEKTIDVGKVNDTYFIETLSFGIDAAIALETMERRKHTKQTGTILYIKSGINQILNHLHPLEAKIEVDNLKFENLFFYTFAIQNGKYYGGGFKICPEASLCDGFLDICYATPPLSKIKAAWVFLKAKNGLHTKEKPIHFLSGTTIHLKFKNPIPVQVDGEALPASEYKVELLPKALRVLSL